jgi:protein tyrosine phosphatase (PTP) superfamily phosphohydrolase (DUF442 family)/catechol 2,3-dioxygenase-like lactoylglutathione lyase family enzyme
MADPETIYHWRRLDDRITTSGQPTEPQLADIQALGVRHIVNLGLHTHEKALPDEAASVSRLGMTYIHIPVDFQNPTDQDFEQFCAVMEQLKEVPVHVHCIANYRVSAFFYRYRRDVLGMGDAKARAEMEGYMAPGGRLGGVRESLGPEARPMTIEINGMAHVILTVSQFEIARAFYQRLLPEFGMKVVHDGEKLFYCVGARTAIGIEPCDPAFAGALRAATGGPASSLSASPVTRRRGSGRRTAEGDECDDRSRADGRHLGSRILLYPVRGPGWDQAGG